MISARALTAALTRVLALAVCVFASSTCLANPSIAGELSGKVILSVSDASTASSATVVWIQGAEAGELPAVDTVLTYKNGSLEPKVSLGFVGQSFVLRNDDTDFHNMHLYMKLAYQQEASQRPLHYGATVYNVPLPLQGKEITKTIKPYHRYRDETGFIEVACNPHPDERAYVLVFDHPYCAIADESGSYKIEGIPAGLYPLFAFRDGVVTEIGEVDVKDGATIERDLELH